MASPQWTYKTARLNMGRLDNVEKRAAKFDEQLNSLGLLGWELVTIEADGHGHKWGFFKKPR